MVFLHFSLMVSPIPAIPCKQAYLQIHLLEVVAHLSC